MNKILYVSSHLPACLLTVAGGGGSSSQQIDVLAISYVHLLTGEMLALSNIA
jgi:hypothetical protein